MPPRATGSEDPQTLVVRLLAGLADEVAAQGSLLLGDPRRSTHQARVALRRLRSLLVSFDGLLDPTASGPLREELKWLFVELGAARDAEVLEARLVGPAARETETARLVAESLTAMRDRAEQRARVHLVSSRSTALLAELASFSSAPPTRVGAYVDVRACVRADLERLVRLASAHRPTPEVLDLHEHLHDVRKAAKRLRYASEPLVELHGTDARRLARRAGRLQEALGEIQDSALAQTYLRSLVPDGSTTPAQAFALGHVCENEHRASLVALRTYARDREKLLETRARWLG